MKPAARKQAAKQMIENSSLSQRAACRLAGISRSTYAYRARPRNDAMHEFIRYGEKTLGTTADQDLSIAEVQQKGLASAGFQGYWMPNQERRVQAFHERLNNMMG